MRLTPALLRAALFGAAALCVSAQNGGDVRLVAENGASDATVTAGRVEVYDGSAWGTVCSDGFEYNSQLAQNFANVVCRQLGKTGGIYITPEKTQDANSSAKVIGTMVTCGGAEENVIACVSGDTVPDTCTHAKDVGVMCDTACTDPKCTICFNDADNCVKCDLSTFAFAGKCYEGCSIGCSKSMMGDGVCQEECMNKACNFDYGDCKMTRIVPSSNGDLKSGRVELYYDDQWGTICTDGLDVTTKEGLRNIGKVARAACGSAGLTGGVYLTKGVPPAGDLVPMFFAHPMCDGTEQSMDECTNLHNTVGCSHDRDLGISCQVCPDPCEVCVDSTTDCRLCKEGYALIDGKCTPACAEGCANSMLNNGKCEAACNVASCTYDLPDCDAAVRLIDSTGKQNPMAGRVEIFNEKTKQWGTVCDDGLDGRFNASMLFAKTVCKQVTGTAQGIFVSSAAAPKYEWLDYSAFGRDGGVPIALTEVACQETDEKLASCDATTKTYYCSHDEDVGVVCGTDCHPSCLTCQDSNAIDKCTSCPRGSHLTSLGKCEANCALDCLPSLLGDGYCDQACNTQGCKLDNSDCDPKKVADSLATGVKLSVPKSITLGDRSSAVTVSSTAYSYNALTTTMVVCINSIKGDQDMEPFILLDFGSKEDENTRARLTLALSGAVNGSPQFTVDTSADFKQADPQEKWVLQGGKCTMLAITLGSLNRQEMCVYAFDVSDRSKGSIQTGQKCVKTTSTFNAVMQLTNKWMLVGSAYDSTSIKAAGASGNSTRPSTSYFSSAKSAGASAASSASSAASSAASAAGSAASSAASSAYNYASSFHWKNGPHEIADASPDAVEIPQPTLTHPQTPAEAQSSAGDAWARRLAASNKVAVDGTLEAARIWPVALDPLQLKKIADEENWDHEDEPFPGWAIAIIVIFGLLFIILVIFLVWYCVYKPDLSKHKKWCCTYCCCCCVVHDNDNNKKQDNYDTVGQPQQMIGGGGNPPPAQYGQAYHQGPKPQGGAGIVINIGR